MTAAGPLDNVGEGGSTSGQSDAVLKALAVDAASGDAAALNDFLSAIKPRVVRYCRGRFGGADSFYSSEEVVQDVLYAVCDALPRRASSGKPVMAWVYGIASNKVVDAFRTAGRSRSEPTDAVPEQPWTAPSVGYGLDRSALRVAGLSDRQIAAVQGLVMGYSSQEQAELVGGTAAALRKDRQRALAKLRESFDLTERELEALEAARRTGSGPDTALRLGVTQEELGQLLGSSSRKIFTTLSSESGAAVEYRRKRATFVEAVRSLSPRELAIMKLVGNGMNNAEVAQRLDVTLKTVEKHLTHIYQELNVSSRVELSAALHEVLAGPAVNKLNATTSAELQAALQRLSPADQQVLALRIILGFSSTETAAATGSTPGAVRVTQHRALNRLRRLLEVDNKGD